ncbi:uncharacterized protein LOC120214571 [Hibiscus syriacus]|uniref:uncharacterized protein LOC120214571 n=1 Tax=Hibiscus syriacus TaxID=106335 RepID=UPI001923F1B7|nr:uncharacterized protein LOC120214571 [Hibiscus syriacus]
MSTHLNSQILHPNRRAVGGTELNWCRAVVSGTGIAVLAILSSVNPDMHMSRLRNAINKLQNSHPILRSRLHHDPNTNTYSFVTLTTPSPSIQIKHFNHSTTSQILQGDQNISPLHLILELELNHNAWTSSTTSFSTKTDVVFASSYALPSAARWALTLMGVEDENEKEITMNKGEISLASEYLLPKGMAKKTLWARGVDMLSYSVNFLSLTNLKFKDAKSPRSTQVVRLLINPDNTDKILRGCKTMGIKLCGALGAAGLMTAHSSKCRSYHQKKKYGVVTLTDCRSILEPPISLNLLYPITVSVVFKRPNT